MSELIDLPPLLGIHHIKLAVSDLQRSLGFYEALFGAKRIPQERWQSHIDSMKLPHSPIIAAIQAWLIVVEDPDGNRLRLYTLETHGLDLKPDEYNVWL